jgi:hypothetical protein
MGFLCVGVLDGVVVAVVVVVGGDDAERSN